MIKPKISRALGVSFKKSKPFFSEMEIKAFKTVGGLVLALVAAAGIMALAVVAPNLIGAIGKLSTGRFRGKSYTQKERRKKVAQTIYYLKKSGMIKFKKTSKDILLFLTSKGKHKLKAENFNALRIHTQAKWDKKWWLVAADIPTKTHRRGADLLRAKLKEMGFMSLQRTLWLYPFDPRQEVQFIAEHFGVEKFLTVMEVNRADRQDEDNLKKHFRSVGVF